MPETFLNPRFLGMGISFGTEDQERPVQALRGQGELRGVALIQQTWHHRICISIFPYHLRMCAD